MEEVLTGMRRISDVSCSLPVPGVIEVQERRQVEVNDLRG